MKNVKLIMLLFLVSSCSLLFPDGIALNPTTYSYEYLTIGKTIDYTQGKFIIAPTTFNRTDKGIELEYVYEFFKHKLKENATKTRYIKDRNGREKFPFNINYDNGLENIDVLATFCQEYQFLVLTKTVYMHESRDIHAGSDYVLNSDTRAGAISYIKVLDLENKNVYFEMACSADVNITEEEDRGLGNMHKNSYKLGEKTMKKILKKIK
ncbi:MAG: hypothetical protein COB98_08355 [Flavobacteriaceae bacterium]|nr:MAG: hypothetical protein COB98_08355 [Flavobacteriaceae bacterium]